MTVPSLVQGRIIYPKIPISDPQGKNPKAGRPFVVITATDEIVPREPIQAIGITGELSSSPKDHYVALEHGPNCRTGFRKPSAALTHRSVA